MTIVRHYMFINTCPNRRTIYKIVQSSLYIQISKLGLPDRVGAHLTCRNGSEPAMKTSKPKFECITKRNKFLASHNAIMIYVTISARREGPWVRILQYGIHVWKSQLAYSSHSEPVAFRRISQNVSSLKVETGL